MRTIPGLILAMVIGVAGCHDLPELGVCGNGIVEASNGEACDGDLPTGNTCSDKCELTCQTYAITDAYVVVGANADLPSDKDYCPDARMRCALDGVCRAGGGQFTPPAEAVDFDVKFSSVGDFDGDLIDDLIGATATSVIVRFGTDRGGALTTSYEQAAPAALSPPAFFDRNPTRVTRGLSDLTMGVPTDGLSLLTSNTESFLPDLDTTFDLDVSAKIQIVVDDPDFPSGGGGSLGEVPYEIDRTSTSGLPVQRIVIPVSSGTTLPAAPPRCGGGAARLVDIAVSRDRRSFAVVSKTPSGFDICHYTHGPTDTSWTAQTTSYVTTAAPETAAPDSVVLADLEGDACPELVLSAVTAQQTRLSYLTSTGPACHYGARVQLTPTPLTLALTLYDAADINPGVGRDEIVTTFGVLAVSVSPPGVVSVAAPTSIDRPWRAAAVVDLDRDGVADVVAGRTGQDDVDVVRGGAPPNVYRADTETEVANVISGDFDGDGHGDVALVERSGTGDRLSFLYGVPTGPIGPAIPNSPFGDSLRLVRLRSFAWGPSSRGHDGVDDLIVLKTPANAVKGRAGFMYGEASRRLTMPRYPEVPPAGQQPAFPLDQLKGVLAAGALDGTGTALAALISGRTGPLSIVVHDINALTWVSRSVTGVSGIVDLVRPPVVLRTADRPLIAFGTGTTTTPSSPGVGLTDSEGHGCALTPAQVPSQTLAVTRLRAVDVMGDDGIDELVVNVGSQVHVYPVTRSGTACTVGVETWGSPLDKCSDVTRVGHQVVALCLRSNRWGLFRLSEAGVPDDTPFYGVDGNGTTLTVGDFDGDAIPDLAVSVARGGKVGAQLVHQCSSTDERGCQ